MWYRIKDFFYRDILDVSLSHLHGWKRHWIKMLRVGALAVRGFFQDQCTLRASSLTYYSLMSIVPIAALVFAIAGGLGFQEYLKEQLLEKLPDQQVALNEIFAFSERLIQQTRSGILAAVGAVVLIWSVTQLFSSMELTFNHIWGIRKLRNWRRMVGDYFSLIFIGPIFFILASGGIIYAIHYIESNLQNIEPLVWVLASLLYVLKFLPYVLVVLLFTFIYHFLPNAHVRMSAAFVGGIFAAALFLVMQWGYFYFQTSLSRYGAIYGSFAALPLFLIWMQMNWFTLLFGAEISYAYQTHEAHEFEYAKDHMSYGFKRLLSLWIVQIAVERFLKRGLPISIHFLTRAYQIPYAIALMVVEELVRANVLVEIVSKHEVQTYLPAKDVHALRLSDVMIALENAGSRDLPFLNSKGVERLERSLHAFQESIKASPENRLFKELSS